MLKRLDNASSLDAVQNQNVSLLQSLRMFDIAVVIFGDLRIQQEKISRLIIINLDRQWQVLVYEWSLIVILCKYNDIFCLGFRKNEIFFSFTFGKWNKFDHNHGDFLAI